MKESSIKLYLKNGYHIEPALWQTDELIPLLNASKQLPNYLDASYRSQMHPHLLDPIFLQALANPRLVRIIEQLVGGKASAIQSQFFFGAPGTIGFNLHQDNFFVHANPDTFVSAWTALEDIGPENGGLIVYPTSHMEEIASVIDKEVPDNLIVHDPNANRIEAILPNHYSAHHLQVKAGDTVFLHANLFHASNSNHTKDKFRRVLLSTYIRRNQPFRAGNYAQRKEIPV